MGIILSEDLRHSKCMNYMYPVCENSSIFKLISILDLSHIPKDNETELRSGWTNYKIKETYENA